MNSVIDISTAKRSCAVCNQVQHCLPQGLNEEDVKIFGQAVRRHRTLKRGEPLFYQGETLDSVYLVRSGALKLYALSDDGDEQILGFYQPGDMLGLDAVSSGVHDCTAVALETSSVCELKFSHLTEMTQTLHSLAQQIHSFYGREIRRDHALLRLLARKSAEQRLTGFLLNLSEQFAKRGFSAHEFHLSMSRHDIANYLGLAIETVSRLFARLQEEGVLRVDRRHIVLLDLPKLYTLAGLSSSYPNTDTSIGQDS